MARRREDDDLYRGRGIQNKKKAAVIIVVLVVAVTGISLTAISFESVDFNEFALLQNNITREIETTVYEEGFYFTGLFATFIKFPSTWVTIEFSPSSEANDIPITANTQDGFQIVIDISFQYRLQAANLLELYSQYGLFYEDFYMQEARSIIRNIASEYNASDFYTNRISVDIALQVGLANASGQFLAQIGAFQLRQVDLPTDIDQALQNLFLTQLDIDQALLEQQAATIRAQTLIIQAQAQANITIIEAEALATALNITITAEGAALFELANQTGMNTTELLIYLWIQAIEMHESAYLFLTDDTPFLFGVP